MTRACARCLLGRVHRLKIIGASGVGGLVLPVGTGWLRDRFGASAMPLTIAAVLDAHAAAVDAQRPPVTSTNAPVT